MTFLSATIREDIVGDGTVIEQSRSPREFGHSGIANQVWPGEMKLPVSLDFWLHGRGEQSLKLEIIAPHPTKSAHRKRS
jgi:hypothetical protein